MTAQGEMSTNTWKDIERGLNRIMNATTRIKDRLLRDEVYGEAQRCSDLMKNLDIEIDIERPAS